MRAPPHSVRALVLHRHPQGNWRLPLLSRNDSQVKLKFRALPCRRAHTVLDVFIISPPPINCQRVLRPGHSLLVREKPTFRKVQASRDRVKKLVLPGSHCRLPLSGVRRGRVALLAVICTSGPRFSLPLCGTDTHYTRAQGCMQPGRAIIRVLLLTLAGLFAPAWHHDTTTPGHQDTTTPAPPPRPHRRKFFIFPSLPSATTGPTPAPSATSPLPPPPPEQPQTTPHLQKGPTERSEGGSTISDTMTPQQRDTTTPQRQGATTLQCCSHMAPPQFEAVLGSERPWGSYRGMGECSTQGLRTPAEQQPPPSVTSRITECRTVRSQTSRDRVPLTRLPLGSMAPAPSLARGRRGQFRGPWQR